MFDNISNSGLSNLAAGTRESLGLITYAFIGEALATTQFTNLSGIKTKANWTTKKTAVMASRLLPLQIEDYEIVKDSELKTQEKTMGSGQTPVIRMGKQLGMKAYNVLPEEFKRLNKLNGKYVYVIFGTSLNLLLVNSPDQVKAEGMYYQIIVSEKQQTNSTAYTAMLTFTEIEPENNIDNAEIVNLADADYTLAEIGLPIQPLYFDLVSQDTDIVTVKARDSKGNPVAGLAVGDVTYKDKATLEEVTITITPKTAGSAVYDLEGTLAAGTFLFGTKGVATQTLKTHESEYDLVIVKTA